MKTTMTTSERKAYNVGVAIAMVIVQAVNIGVAVLAGVMIHKANWLGLGAVVLAKPLASLAGVGVFLVLDLIFMGICKLILKILDRH